MFPSISALPNNPAPTPDPRAHSRLSGARSSLVTPLASYANYRLEQRKKNQQRRFSDEVTSTKIPLSSLAEPTRELGPMGGDFNSGSILKYVPLKPLHHPLTGKNRGTRKVTLYTRRYDPSSLIPKSLDSLVDLAKEAQRQGNHFRENEKNAEDVARRQFSSKLIPHRTEYGFFMGGNSASLHRKSLVSRDNLSRLQYQDLPSENPGLYFGKVHGLQDHKPNSRAFQRFKDSFQVDAGQGEEWEGQGNMSEGDFVDVGGSSSFLLHPRSSKVAFLTQDDSENGNI